MSEILEAIDARDHVAAAFARAEVADAPFSHFFARDVFPPGLFPRMIDAVPPRATFKELRHRDALRADGTSTRRVLPLNDERLAALDGETAALWRAVRDAMGSDRVKRATFRALRHDLARRFRVPEEEVESIEAHPKTAIFDDAGGYAIRPHKDVRTRIVTMQIYLPRDRGQIDLGTSIYRRSLAGRLYYELRKLGLRTPEPYAHVRTFPFEPNAGYAFVVGPTSWHGRRRIPDAVESRLSIMNIWFTSPDQPFYD